MSEKGGQVVRVLVACEFSGVVRSAFAKLGWDAWSCDFLPTEKPGQHYQGDVRDIIGQQWDLMVAHPDCTNHVLSANRWFSHPDDKDLPEFLRRPHPDYPNRARDRNTDRKFVKFLLSQKHIPHIALENPLGTLRGVIGKPSQVIHPYQFGHDRAKSTCLWLKNLPPLTTTCFIQPRITPDGKKRWGNQADESGADTTSPGPERKKIRSRTDKGIAVAMAQQWTDFIISN